MHLENPPVPVGPRNYRFTDFARNPEKMPPCLFTFNRISSTGSAVCISKTHLCRSDPDFTILLFYYFTILQILREIGSLHLENPPVPVGPRNCPFPDFARNPEKIPPSLFTFNRISSTGSAVCISKTQLCRSDPDFFYFTIFYYFYANSGVCISKTHLRRSDPDFTILLFYYFTILLFYYFTILLFYYFTILLFYYFTILLFYYFTILREIGSLHLENPPVPVGPRNYRFTDFARNPEKIPPSLFTFNRISSTGSTVCISKTHLCRSDPDFTILLFY